MIKVWWENEDTGDNAHEPTMLEHVPREGDLLTFGDDELPGRLWEIGPVRWDIGSAGEANEVVVMVNDPEFRPTEPERPTATIHDLHPSPVDYQ